MSSAQRSRARAEVAAGDVPHRELPGARFHARGAARTLKVAYVCPRYAPHVGGVERHVERIATWMAAAGAEVEVLTQERAGAAPAVERVGRVLVRRFPMRPANDTYPVAPGLFAHLAANRDYDIVHGHCYHGLPTLGLLLQRRVPTVFTTHYHGPGHTRIAGALHRAYGPFGARVVRRATQVICVSASEAERVRRDFGLAGEQVVVIPNGVDIQPSVAAAPLPVPGTVALTVGRLEPYKGVMELVEALPHLPPAFVLRVIGGGHQGAALTHRANALGVADRFELVGQVDDEALQRWHKTAAVYVSMSRHEAFGLGVLEAAMAGTPVVASDIAAHREVLSSCSNVRLVPLGAPPAELARAMTRAATADRSVVGPVPTWGEVAESTLAVYQRCLAQRGVG
jgi:glycosyltransferase involved in cell wall biosynthesis